MKIDRICFYLDDALRWRQWFVERLGWRAIASEVRAETRWETVQSGGVRFVLASALGSGSPVVPYLQMHPPGVAEIVLNVADVGAIAARAGVPVWEGHARLTSPAGVTFVVQEGMAPTAACDGWAAAIDHVVLNVAPTAFGPTLVWLQRVLGFKRQQRFVVGTPRSGLTSQVMVHPVSGLRLPVNAPTSANSQIQEFLEYNRGPGVQHIALATPEIVRVVRRLRRSGVEFLAVPDLYYEGLPGRYPQLPLQGAEWAAVRSTRVLVDCPATGAVLLQVFTQPLFGQPTFFLELIERRGGIEGFGEGNFQALFEAMEREQARRERVYAVGAIADSPPHNRDLH